MLRATIPLLLLLAATANADDAKRRLQAARRELLERDAAARLRAVDKLVELDSANAIQAIENALRRSAAEMDRLAGPLDKTDMQAIQAYRAFEAGLLSARDNREVQKLRKLARLLDRRWEQLNDRMRDQLRFFAGAAGAFERFRSAGPVVKIEQGAVGENNPMMRQFYIAGLGHPSRKHSVPVLLRLLADRDPRARAMAVRALREFIREPAVATAVMPLENDPAWAVRRGAYEVMARAPRRISLPYLVGALAHEDGELAYTLRAYLRHLTGARVGESNQAWRDWWSEHGDSVLDGTFEPGNSLAPLKDESRSQTTFFSIPLHSRRVLFAIDFSSSMKDPMRHKDPKANRALERHNLNPTRIGYAKAELIRSLNELPDGAYFNVVDYSDGADRLSGRMLKMSKGTRSRAIRWVLKQKTGTYTNIWAALQESFNDHLAIAGGAQRFTDLPDTVVFLTDGIPTRGRFRKRKDLIEMVSIWNRSADVIIHCVGLGGDHDRELLRSLAASTGGAYLDLQKGVKSLEAKPRLPR